MVWSGNWRRRGSEYIGRARLVQQESTSCREPEKHTCSTEFRAGTLCTSVGDSSTEWPGLTDLHRTPGVHGTQLTCGAVSWNFYVQSTASSMFEHCFVSVTLSCSDAETTASLSLYGLPAIHGTADRFRQTPVSMEFITLDYWLSAR